MTVAPAWEVAEIGRLLYTHALDPELAAAPLGIDVQKARTLVQGAAGAVSISPERQREAALLLNILVRIELRCGHDPVAIRLAIDRPLDGLAGASIAERLKSAATTAELMVLREAAGTMPVAKVKMWRVADRYS